MSLLLPLLNNLNRLQR